jgi:hypothetical protein
MNLRRKHRVAILWASGTITRHRTTGLTVTTQAATGKITGLSADYLWPKIMGIDVEQVVAVFKGRVR